jgi:hypothetical protein
MLSMLWLQVLVGVSVAVRVGDGGRFRLRLKCQRAWAVPAEHLAASAGSLFNDISLPDIKVARVLAEIGGINGALLLFSVN